MQEEDIWIIVISVERMARWEPTPGPASCPGFTTGSPLSQHKCKRDNDVRVRRAASLLPPLVYDATGVVAPAFVLPFVFFFFFFSSQNPTLHYYITTQLSAIE